MSDARRYGGAVAEERQRGPAEAPNLGEPAMPRPAASVVLLRRGGKHQDRALEVLLLKRTEEAKFMPGVWVFPGGAVDPEDGEERSRLQGLRRARARGGGRDRAGPGGGAGAVLSLDHARGRLAPLRRLVLPRPGPRPHAARSRTASRPPTLAGSSRPAALEAQAAGELALAFPTIKQLESLLPFSTSDEAIAAHRERPSSRSCPR